MESEVMFPEFEHRCFLSESRREQISILIYSMIKTKKWEHCIELVIGTLIIDNKWPSRH